MDLQSFTPNETLTREIGGHIRTMLTEIGEDAEREGLKKTPERVGKAFQFLTKGYKEDPEAILRSALFEEDYRQICEYIDTNPTKWAEDRYYQVNSEQ